MIATEMPAAMRPWHDVREWCVSVLRVFGMRLVPCFLFFALDPFAVGFVGPDAIGAWLSKRHGSS
jgi:hypothetical protein